LCVVGDMLTYMDCNDYEDLANELGYSFEEAKKVYKKLEKQYNDLLPIFDNLEEIYDYMYNQYV